MAPIYKKLANHLDRTPGGFPETESGVELRILKRLFTEEEAEIATHLIMMPEPASAIAGRMGKDVDTLEQLLLSMGEKGLILHSKKNGIDSYMTAQFVVGIWEYQVNRLTKGLIKDFNEYVPHLIKNQEKARTKQLRVIPVSKSIQADMKVMAYEEAETIIRSQSRILVAPCICRKEHAMVGNGCGKSMEACLIFGGAAYQYEERNAGRVISQEEALDILHKGIEEGLVLQPGNSKKPMNICMCCGCCCQILKSIKNNDKPALSVNASYFATVDKDSCTACEACMEICPMEAIFVEDIAVVSMDRCIGCGLCVTACDFDSLFLNAKDDENRWEPPENTVETYITIAKEKGLI